MTLDVGLHDIPFDDYLKAKKLTKEPCLSASIIHSIVEDSPLHAWHRHPDSGRTFDNGSSGQANIGTIAHSLILNEKDQRVIVSPYDDFRTKEAREWRNSAIEDGKIVVKEEDMIRAENMAKAFRSFNPRFADHIGEKFKNTDTEVTGIAYINGVWVKIRLDSVGDTILWDLKTTDTASPKVWIKKNVFGYGYDIQSALYQRAWKAITGEDRRFIFAVLEQSEPHDCYPVELDEMAIEAANVKIDYATEKWKRGLEHVFEGYAQGIVTASPTPWMLAEIEMLRGEQND